MSSLIPVPLVSRYVHVIGFTTSEALYAFTSVSEAFGVLVEDIDMDHEYYEAQCTSIQPLTPFQMSEIALSCDVCYLHLNSVNDDEEEAFNALV